ncbi:MAG TPA: hypothetical protein VFC26_04130 [Verrucomicrobiae bacterium]|nr:hypothetical protein [Verrucomicrobiae bacterium]
MHGVAGWMFLCAIGGLLVTYLYDSSSALLPRASAGLCLSLTILGFTGLLVASIPGSGSFWHWFSVPVVIAPFTLLLKPVIRQNVLSDVRKAIGIARANALQTAGALLFYATVLFLLMLVFAAAMFERKDGIYTAVVNNLGDLPFHLKVITTFAYSGEFQPEHPLYAGARFAYPFLTDLLSAMFVRQGADIRAAMLAPNVAVSFSLVILVKQWTEELTGDRLAGFIAPVLLLFSGGLGWIMAFQDIIDNHSTVSAFLAAPPRDYTIRPDSIWRWGNVMTTLFVPQRSFPLGAALAVCVFTLLSRGQSERKFRTIVAAAIMTGLLPLVHVHTFLVVMLAAGWFAVFDRLRRYWFLYFATALLLAGPQLFWFLSSGAVKSETILAWNIGWDRGHHNIFWFWFLNTGFFIPLLVAAALLHIRGRPLISTQMLMLYVPFALCFAIANVLKLAPWIWDNIKVLFYWYLGSLPAVASLLSYLLKRKSAWGIAALTLLATLTAAGALDVWRAITRTASYLEFDRDGIEIARAIRDLTPPRAVVLHAPAYNSPALLAGRRTLLGYTGIVWSHGLQYAEREKHIQQIYKGEAEAAKLLKHYNVAYVLIGPHERSFVQVNDEYFSRQRVVAKSNDYFLYTVGGD